ncbi:MAG: glycosyltransferase family 4 protein [Saprospiraceae bacterium]|uniref:Glycosyltransferase family 4 protein n=1 Tax=Candidatus Opimibacter skivensis TaxID=2982028 RepID=A0A9D7SUA6_9BACT|nr:glycosyltransferase family 4 protein [Candidatus Opimibacter skivensis]
MRILVLTIEYPPLGGGASPMSHEINKNYVQRGHVVEVVTMSFKGLPDEEYVDGIHIHRVPCRRTQKHISYPLEHVSFILAARKFLKKYLHTHSFDVCHTHFIIPTGILARWMYKNYRIPFIITAHGSDVPGFNPDRFYLLHKISPPLIRSIVKWSSAIVVPSMYLSSLLKKVVIHSDSKIIHIPNGINTDYFVPGKKEKIIVSSGRLLERKGFHHLIEAVSPEDIGYNVHICGDGPMMSQLKALASKSKTPIIFHGWIDNRDELYKSILSQATFYCLVSSNENASVSLMEAMSSGCVVITSDVSGCPETVGSAGICIALARQNDYVRR